MKLCVGLLLVLLVATPAYATPAELPPIPLAPDPIGAPNQLQPISWTIFAENGQQMTQFTYFLKAGTPAPSHVTLALCLPRFVRVEGWQHIEIGTDPTSGLTGVKLDNLDGHDLTFSVIVSGVFAPGEMPYAVKAGPEVYSYTIGGPRCLPSAVTLVSFTAAPGAVPVAGWKWTPGCVIPYPWGRWQSSVALCHRLQIPITYRWVWVR